MRRPVRTFRSYLTSESLGKSGLSVPGTGNSERHGTEWNDRVELRWLSLSHLPTW